MQNFIVLAQFQVWSLAVLLLCLPSHCDVPSHSPCYKQLSTVSWLSQRASKFHSGEAAFQDKYCLASIGKLPRFTLEERCGFPGRIRAWLWGVKNYSQTLFCLNGEQRRLALITKGPSEGGVQRKYSFDSNIDVEGAICHQNSFLQVQSIYTNNKQASNLVTQKTQQNSPSNTWDLASIRHVWGTHFNASFHSTLTTF